MHFLANVVCRLHKTSLCAFTRCFTFTLLSLACQLAWGQTTYYVATNGTDANDGRSMASPFQSLAKVNTLTLRAGDAVLLRRGDTFRGTLSIKQSGSAGSPIVVDAYGSGNKPIIAGSTILSGWSRNGNVWQASCSACGDQVTGVYRNATAMPLGRYPNLSDANRGYLTVQSHSGKNQLTSQQGLPTNWTGGEVVVRPTQWIMDRALITGQNGNTLSLNNNSSYNLADGWGFFIQNHPATLDQTGEWYYNPANKTIQVYDSQNDLNSQQITATAFDAGVNLNNSSFVTVRNIHISQTLLAGLAANGGSNLTISGNDITDAGFDGIAISGSNSNVLIENNLIDDINNSGVSIEGYQNFTCRGNTIRRVGMIPGRGKSGDGGYTGILSGANQANLIENNVLDNIGYIGISASSNTIVRNNVVSNFCLTKSDGGGIYSWNGNHSNPGGLHILSNIVYNGTGAAEGMPASVYSGANGIFLDDCSQNSEIANNTTFNSRGKGIIIRGASGIIIRNNTSFGNGEEQLKLSYNGVCQIRNNQIQNNIFLSKYPDQGVVEYESFENDLNQYGQFDYNYYARPFEDQFKIRAIYNPGSGVTGNNFTLAEWQSRWGQDRNSFNSPVTYKSQTVSQTGNTLLDQSFSANTNGWNGYSPYGNGRIDWDNTNKLDGGSMRLSFASASNQGDSYLLAYINIGAVTKGKTYQLLFDGVASGQGKRLQVYPRRLSGNYQDLADRAAFVVGTTRQGYEATFTAADDESNAILLIQVPEDGQTAWVDNLRLQEASLVDVNPDDKIKLYYNATAQDKVQSLDGTYRDAKNNVYSGQVVIAPFSSIVLLRENNNTPPPPTPTTLRDPENPANAVTGLGYQYYEGSWGNLPDFNTLTPIKTGTVTTPNLTVRNRDLNYGLRFTGFVSVPADGVYTFYSSSDDGSKLLIGTTEVVNNDGGHPDQERSGTIGLKAGVHALSVLFFQGSGDQALSIGYSGPNLGKQPIPAGAYRRVDAGGGNPTPTTGTGTGLRADYFNNTNAAAPVIVSRVDATVDFDWGNGSPASGVNTDSFSARWTGQVEAPVSGNYTFSTLGDDGIRLWVNGVLLIDDWNGHPPKLNTGPVIALVGGQKYDIRMEFFDNVGGAVARLLWAYPGQDQQVVPKTRLYPAAGNSTTPTPTTLRDPENPANAVTGLDYQYYEGSWGNLPDFNTLTPIKTGTVTTPNLTVRNRDLNYGLRFTGFVSVPADGVYTFYSSSDDGSKLLIGTTEVVNNDGGHPDQERSGTIGLKAGVHALSVLFFQGSGDQALSIGYSGPNLGKQPIPAGAYRRVDAGGGNPTPTTGTGTGLRADYFNNTNAAAPVIVSRVDATVDFDWGNGSPASGVNTDSFSARWTGQVEAPVSGNYTFSTLGDDGIRLWVNGVLLIDDWNGHPPKLNTGPVIALVGGQKYDIRMEFFDNVGGAVARLLWAYPGQDQQVVPKTRLYPAASSSGGRTAAVGRGEYETTTLVVFPVPARDEVRVRYYAAEAGEVSLQLITITGQAGLDLLHNVVAGENLLVVPVRELTRGLYILTLTQGKQRTSRKVLLTE